MQNYSSKSISDMAFLDTAWHLKKRRQGLNIIFRKMAFATRNTIFVTKCVQVVSKDEAEFVVAKSIKKNNEVDSYDCFFRIFIYYGYYIGIVPFRLDEDANRYYRIRKYYPQLIYCVCIHILILTRQLMHLRGFSLLADDFHKQPLKYFQLTSEVSNLALLFSFCKTVWMNAHNLRLTVQEISTFSQRFAPPPISKVKTRSLAIAICTLFVVLPFVKLASGPAPARDWNFANTFKFNLKYARSTLFLPEYPNITDSGFADFSIADHILAWLSIFLYIYFNYLAYFAYVGTLFASLSIWYPARALARTTAYSSQLDNTPLKMYEAIKVISDFMNDTFGSMVFCFMAYEISYYSLNLDAAIKIEAGWFTIIRLMEIGVHFSFAGFASNICYKVNSLKVWLSHSANHLSISQQKLTLLLDELNCCYVGIKGNGFFTINYSFVGTCFILAVTLFTVMIQFSKINT